MILLLLFCTERVDHGTHHGQAEGQRHRRVGSRAFLAENVFLGGRPAGAAILLGPRRRDPAFLEQDLVPRHEVFLRRELATGLSLELLRIAFCDELADFLSEGLVSGGECDMHGAAPCDGGCVRFAR